MATDCALQGTYSIDNVALSIDGVLARALDEGDDCISVEPGADLGTPKVGADGAGILSISADRSATLTLRLLPLSPVNRFLRGKVARMRSGALTGTSFAIGLTDLSSNESAGCTNAYVSKEPNTVRGATVNALEWQIWCPCWTPGTVSVTAAG